MPKIQKRRIKRIVRNSKIDQLAREFAESYKGYPTAESAFNQLYDDKLRSLAKSGAKPYQLKRFEKIVDAAPLRQGTWSSYSGD